jgi:ribosomal protein S27AE
MWFVIAWVIIGLSAWLYMSVKDWYKGLDNTLETLTVTFFVCAVCGPVVFLVEYADGLRPYWNRFWQYEIKGHKKKIKPVNISTSEGTYGKVMAGKNEEDYY